MNVWFYALGSVLLISLASLVGIFSFSVKQERLKKFLIYMISFSAGALLGDSFFHLLPHIVEENGFGFNTSLFIVVGIAGFFSLEKIVHWQHCHMPITKEHVHSFAKMNLVGDGFHNFIDGLVIGVSYLVSVPVGIATTIAVLLHEIPQEIGDYGILIHGGFSRTKALLANFITAIIAIFGVVIALALPGIFEGLEAVVIPIAVGGFIYIAGSDLIPELHKEEGIKKALLQLLFFALGVAVMILLTMLE